MTTENNKLIAEFLNLLTKENNVKIWDNAPNYINELTRIEDAKFHSDWNWLMEVVDKIESLGYFTQIDTIGCVISQYNGDLFKTNSRNKIESVYNACIEFIKWYNQNKL